VKRSRTYKCQYRLCHNTVTKQGFCSEECRNAARAEFIEYQQQLRLQPVSQYQPQTPVRRKNGTDYKGFVK
jgi:hypothetical protein